jgi:hypothetical protein
MKRFFLLLLAVALLAGCNRGPKLDPVVEAYYRDSLASLTERCSTVLAAAYMAENLLGEKTDIPDWEGYPVELWEYFTGEDIYLHAPKRGLVYMLNPSPEKLARWIVNAVFDATGELDPANIEKLCSFIKWQSGAQFPVSGVVYEDMYTKGFYEPYVFKDGVTVYVADSTWLTREKHPTDEMLEYYLHLTNDQLRPNTGRYARISSTTREMYYAAGGTADVGHSDDGQRSQAWLAEVGRLYREAWNSDKNFLIYAWAKANL